MVSVVQLHRACRPAYRRIVSLHHRGGAIHRLYKDGHTRSIGTGDRRDFRRDALRRTAHLKDCRRNNNDNNSRDPRDSRRRDNNTTA